MLIISFFLHGMFMYALVKVKLKIKKRSSFKNFAKNNSLILSVYDLCTTILRQFKSFPMLLVILILSKP